MAPGGLEEKRKICFLRILGLGVVAFATYLVFADVDMVEEWITVGGTCCRIFAQGRYIVELDVC